MYMDDFVVANLHESRNEWCARLVTILCPMVIQGIRSVFDEAWILCLESNDPNKYLMTFQNLLSRIPKWNDAIIEDERKRIIEKSGCHYLEDLITCVHIIQLKLLTCIRVGNKQKKIDISVPKLDVFIHKVYIQAARKVYTNVYLFDKKVHALQAQKNHREFEMMVQECIMVAIRESIPTEEIIRAYMDESVEQEEEVVIENLEEPVITMEDDDNTKSKDDDDGNNASKSSIDDLDKIPETVPAIKNVDDEPVITRLTFNDVDSVHNGVSEELVDAPKTIERLEEISRERALQRRLEEDEETEDKIHISADSIDLGELDILDINGEKFGQKDESFVSLDDIIELN
jgi:hypothetical protein